MIRKSKACHRGDVESGYAQWVAIRHSLCTYMLGRSSRRCVHHDDSID